MSDETQPGSENPTPPEPPTDASQSTSAAQTAPGEAAAFETPAPVPEATSSVPASDSELVEPDDALPEVRLDDLSDRMRNAARAAGWSSLMPVQAKSIPYVLAQRDLMIQSQTGSGKTGAFVLPLLERIDTSIPACQALILIPTRELALQVQREAELLAGASGVRTVAVYGGVAYGPQLDAFRAGAHIVVGTPGRVLDHLLKRSLTLESLRMLVFDEADRMLSMGFYPDMKQVQRYLPKTGVNGYMFSATYPVYVMRLAAQFLTKPEFLSLSSDHVHAAGTTHVYYEVPQMDKDRCLVRIIEIENPASAIVFCNTRQQVHYVTTILQRFGYDADELSSDLGQAPREKVLARVRNRSLRFLVATDVAARGIDIQDLSHVFLYDVPEDPESYVHRAGRTGRAGATGEAISLVAGIEPIELQRIAKRFNITMERRPAPTEEDVATVVSQRLVAVLEARLRTRDKLHVERMQRFLPLVRGLADSEDESALMAMLLDDLYHQTLHAPTPEPSEADAARAGAGAGAGACSAAGGSAGTRREVPGSEDRERYSASRKPRRRSGRSR